MRSRFFTHVASVLPVFKYGSGKNTIRSVSGVGVTPLAARVGAKTMVHVDTSTEAYRHMAKELTFLSTEEFSRRLHRFSRTNFDPSQTAAVHAHVSELLSRRLAEVSYKCVREYGQLAHVAGLHELCLAIYYGRANLVCSSSMAEANSVAGSFAVSDSVVDSAYSLGSTSDLVRLGAHCMKHLQHEPSLGWEVMSSFSLARTFWRCVCIVAHLEKARSVDAKQALQGAAYIFKEYIAVLYPEASRELSVQDAIYTVRRFVQYASCGDEGEMLFFRFCLRRGFLRRGCGTTNLTEEGGSNLSITTSDTGSGEVSYGGSANGATRVDHGVISEEQWFYATLIATCRAGQHVHEALHYFDEVGSRLGVESVGCDVLLGHRSRAMRSGTAADGQDFRAVGECEKIMEGVSDYLFFQLLTVLHAAKDNRKIVFTARAMLRCAEKLSISVWSIVLIAAGEMRAADVALGAFVQAKDALSDATRVEDRRGNEYLLQTSLLALSKCQVPRFEEEYLRPCRELLLTHSNEEVYFCALLQHAHNSTDPGGGAGEVSRAVSEKGIPLSSRIVSRLMKIYLRTESPKLLELYRYATRSCNTFKASWLDELLLWADRRRYDLTPEERKYILDEVYRVYGDNAMESELSGLRTQLALLRYDYEHKPRETFLATLQPPPTEPTVLDSRAHFLVKKPYCVHQRRPKNGKDLNEERSGDRIVVASGDQSYGGHSIIQGQSFSGSDGNMRPEEFRVYMEKILEVLQRTNNWVT
ncbi:hypothetical protein, conserved [Trypanosoma brucei gambiense DAL972]|uniref:Uncharacterized protein n=1 Tax=Trypanosoma brucei gambiense (strain MHOM/CI/86/DAL972) TaxID=679716 RepID=C9ZMZ9_TRYB9|nr:hypothetical protein, conserved [Trypanosoma brucei gambiense DAL972]CBH10653.1 hypothetical protein, conserved [Trypanosoma brucei gambiense DAL972]|eukprot:XP_011772941.1 hypothetical protein, conserved [Trypanosoma brucei gambiense DAL972]